MISPKMPLNVALFTTLFVCNIPKNKSVQHDFPPYPLPQGHEHISITIIPHPKKITNTAITDAHPFYEEGFPCGGEMHITQKQ